MKKAFTLIELLVVIGIIAILTGAGVTMFSGATRAAERARAQELVSNTATALTALFDTNGVWPAVLRQNGASDGRLDAETAYPLAKYNMMTLSSNESTKRLSGYDKFGIVTPWATATIKSHGTSAQLSTVVAGCGSSTIQDHILHYAIDLDGDGIIDGANVGGESLRVRATAMVWCCGKDGKLEKYSRGLRRDDVYSWTIGQTRQ